MEKISDYLIHAEECRRMAAAATDPAHREALLRMAQTWTELAAGRSREIERSERLKAIELKTQPKLPQNDQT